MCQSAGCCHTPLCMHHESDEDPVTGLCLPGGSFPTLLSVRRGDELQEGRIKVIHTFGSTAKIALQFNPGAAQYTGLYAGSCCALCRISPARMGFNSFTPGMGIKARADAPAQGHAASPPQCTALHAFKTASG